MSPNVGRDRGVGDFKVRVVTIPPSVKVDKFIDPFVTIRWECLLRALGSQTPSLIFIAIPEVEVYYRSY